MLQFTIQPRMQTRRTQYNLKDVLAAISRANLTYTRPNYLIHVTVKTLEERKRLEYNLKLVHVNIPYLIKQIQEESNNV